MRLEIGDRAILLNHDTKIYPHHLGERWDFSKQIAKLTQHPKDPRRWGIQNISGQDWRFSLGEAPQRTAAHGATIPLKNGVRLFFGRAEGLMRSK